MRRNIKEKIKKELKELFDGAIHQKTTPGIVVAVALVEGGSCVEKFFVNQGTTQYGRIKSEVTEHTFFDLASLTKPLVTVVSLMTLLQDNRISLHSSLDDLLEPAFVVPGDKKSIKLWQLMSHCAGLPAHRTYYVDALAVKKHLRRDFIVRSILAEELEYQPGLSHLYSDLGYILLGVAIEKLTGRPLDGFFKERVLIPYGLKNVLKFGPLSEVGDKKDCAVTEIEPWTHKQLCGVVHDDNCRVMGGIAGHAGLFGTARGVLELCSRLGEIWQGGERVGLFSSELLKRVISAQEGSSWTCGFDTPSLPHSSSGNYFGPSSIGHLGFTGTSIWMDLPRGIVVVMLTNRVHPSRKNEAIKRLRPDVHNIVMGNLLHRD